MGSCVGLSEALFNVLGFRIYFLKLRCGLDLGFSYNHLRSFCYYLVLAACTVFTSLWSTARDSG